MTQYFIAEIYLLKIQQKSPYQYTKRVFTGEQKSSYQCTIRGCLLPKNSLRMSSHRGHFNRNEISFRVINVM